jgi:hypothetical protein
VNENRTGFAKRDGKPAKHLLFQSENPIQINEADVAELVDARDLKSLDGNVVWVRVPPPAPANFDSKISLINLYSDLDFPSRKLAAFAKGNTGVTRAQNQVFLFRTLPRVCAENSASDSL